MPNEAEPTVAPSRRTLLAAGAGLMAAAGAAAPVQAAHPPAISGTRRPTGILTMKDGTGIYYKDWGAGQPMLFSHGWPLNADAWDGQMAFFGANGFRVVAHDRRSHGRSDQTWNGNTMDQYADDLAELLGALDLRDVILVGHSTGGGEVARYIGRHGSARIAKVVLVGAVPPLMLRTDSNPDGVPMEVFDGLRKGTLESRSQFFKDLAVPFYGFNRPGAKPSQGLIDAFWLQGMSGGIKGELDCIREFSEIDYTADLRRIDRPTLVIHGDADQIVPFANAGAKTARIVEGAQLKVYSGGSHGLAQVQMDRFNQDVLEFARR
ncbi:MAG: alpha/beta fold hydrolase [Janthinobacterium lividum]